jgi:hypothetical protein
MYQHPRVAHAHHELNPLFFARLDQSYPFNFIGSRN